MSERVNAPSDARPDEEREPQDPAEIRADIDSTREELGHTIEGLVERADVKSRAQQVLRESASGPLTPAQMAAVSAAAGLLAAAAAAVATRKRSS